MFYKYAVPTALWIAATRRRFPRRDMSRRTKRGRVRALQNCPANPVAPIFKGTRTILLLRSGVSADRRKYFRLFSDGGALPRRRYAK
jgi:hypothetical protein